MPSMLTNPCLMCGLGVVGGKVIKETNQNRLPLGAGSLQGYAELAALKHTLLARGTHVPKPKVLLPYSLIGSPHTTLLDIHESH